MNLTTCCKQSVKGVLSTGSGAHDRQRSGAIPAEPSQTALKIASDSEFATFYVFLPVARYFFGHSFSRADLAGAHKWNMQRNDVILGAPSFLGIRGFGPRGWLRRPDIGAWFKLTSKSVACHAFQLTPVLSTGSPQGMARC